jgi:hypothetical protein
MRTSLIGESIDALFQRFTVVVNDMRAMWTCSRTMIMIGLSSLTLFGSYGLGRKVRGHS